MPYRYVNRYSYRTVITLIKVYSKLRESNALTGADLAIYAKSYQRSKCDKYGANLPLNTHYCLRCRNGLFGN